MRQIVAFEHVSADGYFASPNGQLDWFGHDTEFAADSSQGLGESDTLLFGRTTYEMFASFWATADESMGPFAKWLNDTSKIVFSHKLEAATWRNTRLIRELVPREIAEMKRQSGKAMMIFGSGSIVAQLTEHGLIDEYQYLVRPIHLGAGRSLITNVTHRQPLKLVKAKSYGSGSVLLHYSHSPA